MIGAALIEAALIGAVLIVTASLLYSWKYIFFLFIFLTLFGFSQFYVADMRTNPSFFYVVLILFIINIWICFIYLEKTAILIFYF